ncbi:DUF2931 family protein [Lelliottia sp. WAP21]|uniref:DUF2931 family protein n=1 Tax=Lelliottia sp. WAP21 TaxID=2877426 RepID=UPI001E4D70EA|nr:DUF2931 family protein [Lelliottia sp. WAP21]
MKTLNILTVALLMTTSGCVMQKSYPLQSKQAASADWTLPYEDWSFSFVTPKYLRAEATHVRIIDTDGYRYIFNTLDQTSRGPDSIDKWASAIHGPSINFNKAKKPPQYIVFCWESYIDQETYETSAIFGPETWLRMKTPADHTRPSGAPVWYNRMVFGLSPGGKVKIWFSDVEGRPSLPVKPIKLRTLSGKDLTLCKDYVVPGGLFNFIQSTQDFIKGKTYPYGNWD